MNEIRHDLGYHDELPSEESQRAMRRILAGETPNDPKPDWKLDEETKAIGRRGIVDTRAELARSGQHRVNREGIADSRAILEAKRKQSLGEALSPEEERILARLHARSNSDF